MLNLISSMFLSLVPRPWRGRWAWRWEVDLVRGALVSGLLECLGCVAAYGARYLLFLQDRVGDMAMQVIAKNAESVLDARSVQFGMGFITMLDYMIRPVSMLLMYFVVEGLVRFAAALVSDEVVATLPLHLVACAQQRISKAAAERALGPRVVDEVQAGEWEDMRIANPELPA